MCRRGIAFTVQARFVATISAFICKDPFMLEKQLMSGRHGFMKVNFLFGSRNDTHGEAYVPIQNLVTLGLY